MMGKWVESNEGKEFPIWEESNRIPSHREQREDEDGEERKSEKVWESP